MNIRFVPSPKESTPRRLLTHLNRLQQLARYQRPRGVDVLTGKRGASPLRASGQTPTVLALHGFCGIPQEVAVGVDAARQLGLAAHAPLLEGHGAGPENLRSLRYKDWLRGARREFDNARQRGPVILVGMSLGSLLATELATQFPEDVIGLVVLSNACWVRPLFPGSILSLVDWLHLPDFGFPSREQPLEGSESLPPGYHVQPVHSAISVVRAGRRIRDRLPKVKCPTLILHGAKDEVCRVENAWRFAARLGTSDRRVVILPESKHVMTLGEEAPDILDEVRSFIARRAS